MPGGTPGDMGRVRHKRACSRVKITNKGRRQPAPCCCTPYPTALWAITPSQVLDDRLSSETRRSPPALQFNSKVLLYYLSCLCSRFSKILLDSPALLLTGVGTPNRTRMTDN
eukprot:1189341-Prorocentrum_minimum.AAC.1